ncbi:MAG: hypothetical protein ACRDZO_14355 [Egibacteraceae bacterium]
MEKVTLFEVLRLALGFDIPTMCAKLELCGGKGASLHRRTLGGWEARRHTPNPLGEQAARAFFNVDSVGLLGLGWTADAARNFAYMTKDQKDREMLHRRQLLKQTGLAGIAGISGLLLPASPLVADAQLLDGLPSISGGTVDFALHTATHLAVVYAAAPDADTVRAADAHARTLLDLLTHAKMTLTTRTRLQAAASDAAALAGYAELDAGRLTRADAWFATALELARRAGDRRLEALAIASTAWPALDAPQPDRTKALAAFQAAAELQRFLPPATRTWIFGYLAREHATLGDDLASGQFLDLAHTAAARILREGPGSGWWSTRGELAGMNATRLDVFTARRSLLLGHPTDALDIFDDALAATTAPVRRASLHENIITACIALDDPERAITSAHAALDECHPHGLAGITTWIRRARTTFPPHWNTHPPTLQLDERLHTPT